MSIAGIKGRLARLERCGGGCGPGCPLLRLIRGDGPAAPCPRCGRPAKAVRLVRDRNFFGNAERLRGLTT